MARFSFQTFSRAAVKPRLAWAVATVLILNSGFSRDIQAQGNAADAGNTPVVVKVQPLSDITTAQRQFAPAIVLAANRATVAARVAANIEEVEVEVGQRVEKGQVLARLDRRDFVLALEQAKALLASTDAQIEQANLRLKRARELSGNQFISADDLLARETDVVVLTANRSSNNVAIRIAENDLVKTVVVAPFDAVVVARFAQAGSYVTPATQMFELVQLDSPEVEAQVGTDLIDSVKQGRALRFDRNGSDWPLSLLRVSPVVVTDSGAQLVRLAFEQSNAPIGSSGRISWLDAGGMIPADILVRRGSELGVFVAEGNRARFHVVTGAQEGRPASTTLALDTRVVTIGRYKLQDGQRITIAAN
ncbi:MAG: efflux RND transporter periplasmic adaptor subunit [Gammaproteobacteria bacterium]